jgi:hypothetical protein
MRGLLVAALGTAAVIVPEAGTAFAQPPNSSRANCVGAAFAGVPKPFTGGISSAAKVNRGGEFGFRLSTQAKSNECVGG